MERKVGTVSRGIRCPIIRQGDNLVDIAVTSVLEAAESEGFELRDRDVVSLTESIVARAQGNYASVDDIAADVKAKLGGETIGVIFPILSRNRFAICLRGIAKGAKKVVLMLSYPSDEVGNSLVTYDQIDEAGINPYSDVLDEAKYRELFGENKHEFTGVDYVAYYSEIIREAGAEAEIIFANQPKTILELTGGIIEVDKVFRHYIIAIIDNPYLLFECHRQIIGLLIVERVIAIVHDGFIRLYELKSSSQQFDKTLFKAIFTLIFFYGFGQVLVVGLSPHPVEELICSTILV